MGSEWIKSCESGGFLCGLSTNTVINTMKNENLSKNKNGATNLLFNQEQRGSEWYCPTKLETAEWGCKQQEIRIHLGRMTQTLKHDFAITTVSTRKYGVQYISVYFSNKPNSYASSYIHNIDGQYSTSSTTEIQTTPPKRVVVVRASRYVMCQKQTGDLTDLTIINHHE